MSDTRRTTRFETEVFAIEDPNAFRERIELAYQHSLLHPWDTLDGGERQALALILRLALLRLLEDPPEQWIPIGLTPTKAGELALVIRVSLADVGAETIALRADTEHRMARHRANLLDFLEELSDANATD